MLDTVLTSFQVLQAVGSAWTGVTHLLTEVRLLNQKYPLDLVPMPATSSPAWAFTVEMMVQNAKVYLGFIVDASVLARWPSSAAAVRCEGRLAYGDIE
jgi:hypothetical protein